MSFYDIDGNVVYDSPTIETYYATEMADTISKVRSIINEPALVFPVTTDLHRYSSAPQTFDKMITNMAHFVKSVKCDFVACLGDLVDGNSTQAKAYEYAYDSAEKFNGIGVPYIFAQGNHDNNVYDTQGNLNGADFDIKQVFDAFFTSTKGVSYNFSENGTDYYIDFAGIGVRLIVLNACNVKKAKNYAYGDSTATWLSETALNTSHTVLIFEHLSSIASQVWNNNHGTNATNVTNAIQAFVNNGGRVVQLSGHSHIDLAFIAPWLSIVFACSRCEAADISTANYAKITGYIDVQGNPARTEGTATEDLWTVCVLKPNSGELDCIRFGAGTDRYIHYLPISPGTVTTRLTGVTWSSSDTSVATVVNGVITGVAAGTCAVLAKDSSGNYEAWIVKVT